MFKYNVEYRTNKYQRPDIWHHSNAFNDESKAKLYALCIEENHTDIIDVRIKEV